MTIPEMEDFANEAERIDRTLHDIEPEDWGRPALGEWNIAQLAFHLVRQADRLDAYRDRPLSADAPAVNRVEYYRRAAEQAADVAARAIEGAAGIDLTTLPGLFSDAWQRSMASATDARALIETVMGPMRTGEFAATRVVELVVHHMDLRRALDLPTNSDPGAARLVINLLEELLVGPRPRNLGRTRFILAATGRIPHDDPRLPVLT